MKSGIFVTAFCLILIGFTSSTGAAETRTWTHKSGQSKIVAQLVEHSNGTVKLQKSNGQILTFPDSEFSSQDQNYLNFLKNNPKKKTEKKVPSSRTPNNEKTNDGNTVEIVALSVRKGSKFQNTKETKLELLVTSQSKISNIKKDAKSILSLKDNLAMQLWGQNCTMDAKISDTGNQILVTLVSPRIPAVGAQKMTLEGKLLLQAESETTPSPENVALEQATEPKKVHQECDITFATESKESVITLGGRSVTVKRLPTDDFMIHATDMAKMKIGFYSDQPLPSLDDIVILDAETNPVSYVMGNASETQIDGKMIHGAECYLTEVLDSFQLILDVPENPVSEVVLDQNSETQTITIPILLEVGLGL